jgi:hypothetical protein
MHIILVYKLKEASFLNKTEQKMQGIVVPEDVWGVELQIHQTSAVDVSGHLHALWAPEPVLTLRGRE